MEKEIVKLRKGGEGMRNERERERGGERMRERKKLPNFSKN